MLRAPNQSQAESAETAVAAQLTRFNSRWQLQLAGVGDYVMPPVWWREQDAVSLIWAWIQSWMKIKWLRLCCFIPSIDS